MRALFLLMIAGLWLPAEAEERAILQLELPLSTGEECRDAAHTLAILLGSRHGEPITIRCTRWEVMYGPELSVPRETRPTIPEAEIAPERPPQSEESPPPPLPDPYPKPLPFEREA